MAKTEARRARVAPSPDIETEAWDALWSPEQPMERLCGPESASEPPSAPEAPVDVPEAQEVQQWAQSHLETGSAALEAATREFTVHALWWIERLFLAP